MSKEEVFGKLTAIVEDIKGDVAINEDTPLIEAGILDSLEVLNYLTQIEEQFNISISMDELVENKLGIIRNMISYIISKS